MWLCIEPFSDFKIVPEQALGTMRAHFGILMLDVCIMRRWSSKLCLKTCFWRTHLLFWCRLLPKKGHNWNTNRMLQRPQSRIITEKSHSSRWARQPSFETCCSRTNRRLQSRPVRPKRAGTHQPIRWNRRRIQKNPNRNFGRLEPRHTSRRHRPDIQNLPSRIQGQVR